MYENMLWFIKNEHKTGRDKLRNIFLGHIVSQYICEEIVDFGRFLCCIQNPPFEWSIDQEYYCSIT